MSIAGNVGGRVAALRPRMGARRLRRVGAPYLYVLPALAFLAAVELYPIAYNLRNSLVELNVGTFLSGEDDWIGLRNYSRVLSDDAFVHAVGVSMVFTAASIALQFSLGLALALFFQRSFPGSTVLRALLVLGWLLPGVVTGNLFRWLLDGDSGVVTWLASALHLGDHAWLTDPGEALWAAVATNVWVGIPFNMLLLLPGLQAIPEELYDAAEIDGANAWQRFRYITLPLLRPVTLIVIVLGVIYTFKVFDLVFALTRGGPVDATEVLPIYIYDLSLEFFRFGEGAAASTLLLLGMLVVAAGYLWLSRREGTES
jgi:multiple sugar transport system permease protein